MKAQRYDLLVATTERTRTFDAGEDERMLAAIERERRHLAEALHDEVMPFGYQAERVLREALGYASEHPRRCIEQVGEALALTSTLLERLRGTLRAYYVMPGELVGLSEALRVLTQSAGQQAGLSVAFSSTSFREDDVTPGEAALLYAIAREAIGNVVKHAGASSLSVTLQRAGETLQLAVCDNGQGFVVPRTQDLPGRGHLGLSLLWTRAQSLQAALEIASSPGEGTSVVIRKGLAHPRPLLEPEARASGF